MRVFCSRERDFGANRELADRAVRICRSGTSSITPACRPASGEYWKRKCLLRKQEQQRNLATRNDCFGHCNIWIGFTPRHGGKFGRGNISFLGRRPVLLRRVALLRARGHDRDLSVCRETGRAHPFCGRAYFCPAGHDRGSYLFRPSRCL
jgi:hypothetical protein